MSVLLFLIVWYFIGFLIMFSLAKWFTGEFDYGDVLGMSFAGPVCLLFALAIIVVFNFPKCTTEFFSRKI